MEVIYDGGATRMVVSGELDIATAPWLAQAVDDELDARHDVIIDLSAARLGDSTPIEALVRARSRAADNGWRLEVVPQPWPLWG